MKTLDLINGAFAPDNLSTVLDQMHKSRNNELKNMYGKNLLADWVEYDQLIDRLSTIKIYANERANHILKKMREYFGLGEIYQLIVYPEQGSQVMINSFVTDHDFIGSYYTNYITELTAKIPEGKVFDHWLVNGDIIKEERLQITQERLKNNKVEVFLILK